jgi:glycosyltransferase involved in cell wall biosynthesis
MFVSSSRVEGFGLAILEALALGIPVVATNCYSGPAEILDNGKYGILVDKENTNALVSAMESIFSTEVHDKFSSLGRKRADDYSSKNIIKLWKNVLFELV